MFREIAAALGLVFAATAAFAQGGKVTVVTSFSKDVTDPIKKAFEKAVPGTTLEVQNRNTNAGVKFLEETKGNNQVDLFWASAPDAFEVLKGKKLLDAYKPKATGIARTRANSATMTVTWTRSKTPNRIAAVLVVSQLPP